MNELCVVSERRRDRHIHSPGSLLWRGAALQLVGLLVGITAASCGENGNGNEPEAAAAIPEVTIDLAEYTRTPRCE